MRTERQILNRLIVASPWLAVAVLMGMSMLLPNRSEFTMAAELRKAEVAQAMQAVPMYIGRWMGENRDVPKEAQKLLHPNAILSRSYSSPGAPPMRVLVVHCGDARDMRGHYPPICYPSAGWVEVDVDRSTEQSLHLGEHVLPVREYSFRCIGLRGRPETIRIFNAFILPDGKVTTHIEDISDLSERLAVSVQGVAQLQVITSASVPVSEAIEAANDLLGGMTIMFNALNVGREGRGGEGVSSET